MEPLLKESLHIQMSEVVPGRPCALCFHKELIFFTLSDMLRDGFCLSHMKKPKIMIWVQLAVGKSCILRV